MMIWFLEIHYKKCNTWVDENHKAYNQQFEMKVELWFDWIWLYFCICDAL